MNDTVKTIKALGCEHLARLFNHAIEHDPLTQQKLSELAGKALLVESTAPRFTACVLFSTSGLTIFPSDDAYAANYLSGTAPALIRFALGGDIEAAENCKINISDQDGLIKILLPLIPEINIDWEAILAEKTGDVPAHLLGELLRNGIQLQQDIVSRSKSGWTHFTTDNFSTDRPESETGERKPLSPLDTLTAQLKALLP